MIRVTVEGYDRKTIVYEVPDGVWLELDRQDPIGGRQRVLRVLNETGVPVALFANWTTASKDNDPVPGDGFLRRQAAAMADAKENNA
jgi:hypothetical protein